MHAAPHSVTAWRPYANQLRPLGAEEGGLGPCPGTRIGDSLVHNRALALRAAKRHQESAATAASTAPSTSAAAAAVPQFATTWDATQFTVLVRQRLGAHSLAFAAFLETLRVRGRPRPGTHWRPGHRRSRCVPLQHFARGQIRADEVVEIMVRLLQVRQYAPPWHSVLTPPLSSFPASVNQTYSPASTSSCHASATSPSKGASSLFRRRRARCRHVLRHACRWPRPPCRCAVATGPWPLARLSGQPWRRTLMHAALALCCGSGHELSGIGPACDAHRVWHLRRTGEAAPPCLRATGGAASWPAMACEHRAERGV